MRRLTQTLAHWLEEGGAEVGEILIQSGERRLCALPSRRSRPQRLAKLRGARSRARARALRRCGRFPPAENRAESPPRLAAVLETIEELRRALDYFYPAMLGVWLSHLEGDAGARAAARHAGAANAACMRVTQKITDAQARRDDRRFLPHGWRLPEAHPLAARAGRADHLAAAENFDRVGASAVRCRCSATKPAICSSRRRARS